IGLTFGGICAEDAPVDTGLPPSDPNAYAFVRSIPEPEPEPIPAPAPVFPPVIIKEVVRVEPAPPPEIIYVEKPAPDPVELAVIAALGNRKVQLAPLPSSNILQAAYHPNGISAPPGKDIGGVKAPTAKPEPEYDAEGRISGLPVDNSRILTADRYISGILETGINSQLDSEDGGTAIIQVSRDVFGYHNRNILIPRGSRLICDYDSPKKAGSTRLSLQCNRILLGETRVEIFQLAATIGDPQGHAGITGEVDNRWFEKYGSAIILSAISATFQGAASLANNPAGGDTSNNATAAQEAAANLSERFGEISASVLEQTVNLAPIVTISQGTRVQIRPQFDWYIQDPSKP
ncbi:TrbI/VirB10 family protein, partial [Kiloniella laminariae]|uniref:TrbI/VirB10 family protein n=1 Tax=Kiloniella laminariae TaxID=454162 RepID=UPI00036AC49C